MRYEMHVRRVLFEYVCPNCGHVTLKTSSDQRIFCSKCRREPEIRQREPIRIPEEVGSPGEAEESYVWEV